MTKTATIAIKIGDRTHLVSALIFSRRNFAWLREAWLNKRFVPLASHDTVSELLRVLAYPKFKLTHDDRESLLAQFHMPVLTVAEFAVWLQTSVT